MNRQERILKDRGEMARRALVEAKYLNGDETPKELADNLPEIVAHFLADVFHFMESQGTSRTYKDLFDTVTAAALEAHESDVRRSRF